MSSQARPQTSKIHPSKSFLKLIESSRITQYDKTESNSKLTRARTGLKSTLKSRRLADTTDAEKTNISFHAHNRSLYPHDIQKSFQAGYNNLVESFNHSNPHSPSYSNSPKRASKNKSQKLKLKAHDLSKVIKISSETDRKNIEAFTPKKLVESRFLQKGISHHCHYHLLMTNCV